MDKPIKKLSSFKKLPKAPPPSQPTMHSPGLMKPGTVLTDIEMEGLKKLGIVTDTSKLPSNIAEKVHAVISESKNISLPDVPVLKVPDAVPFEDIPEEKKKEIMDFIAKANADATAPKAAPAPPMTNPDLFPKPLIIDDLDEVTTKSTEPVIETPHVHNDSGLLDKDKVVNCPQCGWDTRKDDTVAVTDNDKIDFVQSILGGIRFRKSYQLFGGKMTLVFRTLTTAESDMAYKQLLVDANNDIQTKIISDTSFYWRTLMAYKAVMSVDRIESDSNVLEIPPIADIEVDEGSYSKPNTKLYAVFDQLVESVMPSEVLRNAISHLFTEFTALVEKMQAMAEDKDFWQAIK